MKLNSNHGWGFIAYGLAVSAYFSAACIGRWPAPKFPDDSGSGGSSYSRSSGGSWGGGK